MDEYFNPNEDNSVVEYEIVDEHGNQIMISGAEQLKKLATCVNEIRQADGSIVKEYILNDPDIIEQIRQQIKDQSTPTTTMTATASVSVAATTNGSVTPTRQQPKLQQQQQQQQQEFLSPPSSSTATPTSASAAAVKKVSMMMSSLQSQQPAQQNNLNQHFHISQQ